MTILSGNKGIFHGNSEQNIEHNRERMRNCKNVVQLHIHAVV